MDIEKRISELIDLINYHNEKYYNEDTPEIDDFEYDHLMKELVKLEEESPMLKRVDSPSNRVGGKALDKFDQIVHKYPMLSLSNAYSAQDLRDFDRRVREAVSGKVEYVVEFKIDGLSVSLTYENGEFVKGATRGDGVLSLFYYLSKIISYANLLYREYITKTIDNLNLDKYLIGGII